MVYVHERRNTPASRNSEVEVYKTRDTRTLSRLPLSSRRKEDAPLTNGMATWNGETCIIYSQQITLLK